MKRRINSRWLQREAPKVGERFANQLRTKAGSYPYRSSERNQLIAQAKEFEHEQALESMRFIEEVLTGRWTKNWSKDLNATPTELFAQLREWVDTDKSWENPYLDGWEWSDKVSGGWTKASKK